MLVRPALISVLIAVCWAACGLPEPAAASGPEAKRRAPGVTAQTRAALPYLGRAELAVFAHDVATRQGWEQGWVIDQLGGARQLPRVAQLVMPAPAGVTKNWAAYHDRFVEPRRIGAGVAFWQAHAEALQRAEGEYGVPAEIVVGIIGVESFYGRMTGDFRSIDALATLAFDFPRGRSDRSQFFREELEELLILARREGVRADSLRGSFAGAIGWPQFMPGSINRHAVDFDGDGHIDLRASVADAIGSVAHFLQQHGWQRAEATHFGVQPPADADARATLLAPDILPSFSTAQMRELGAQLDPQVANHGGPLALVQVFNGEAAPSYVAGTQNFYALTRYNRSSYYALAVIALGDAVKSARTPDATLVTSRRP